jgi:hypothetical protein
VSRLQEIALAALAAVLLLGTVAFGVLRLYTAS